MTFRTVDGITVSLSVSLNWPKNIAECDVPIQFLAGSKKHKRIHWSSGNQSPAWSKLLIVWWRFTILAKVFSHQSESISSPTSDVLSFVEIHRRFGDPSLLHSFLLLYRVPLTHKPEWRKQQLPQAMGSCRCPTRLCRFALASDPMIWSGRPFIGRLWDVLKGPA